MGRYESAIASIGIRILLSDLVPQIKATNFKLIKGMLRDGFIEDENEFFNGAYSTIQDEMDSNKNWAEFKQQFDVRCKDYVDGESLFEKALLLPIKPILRTGRWGYHREGTNASSKPLKSELSINLDKYKVIKKFKTVFILCQDAG